MPDQAEAFKNHQPLISKEETQPTASKNEIEAKDFLCLRIFFRFSLQLLALDLVKKIYMHPGTTKISGREKLFISVGPASYMANTRQTHLQ